MSSASQMSSDPVRERVLEAALQVFLRYGFRKSSMDEVARAAHLSRQGLYLHFRSKEELFRATVEHFVRGTEAAAGAHLTSERPLHERLADAFDALMGRFVGTLGADTADLAEASSTLVGALLAEHEESACELVAKALRHAGAAAAYRASGLSVRQLAETLCATARGWKHHCQTREEFRERMSVAARAACYPLGKGA
jgi:TetR/AcrR family transcriptional regulator, regulator of autoinduction and epiphytic fitness